MTEIVGIWIGHGVVSKEEADAIRPLLEAATRGFVTQVVSDRVSWRFYPIDDPQALVVVNDVGEVEVVPNDG